MNKMRTIAISALLSSLACILFYLELPNFLFPIAPFLKFDGSDIPALIGGFGLGVNIGIIIELVKCIFHLSTTRTVGLGELASFVTGVSFVSIACKLYKSNKLAVKITNGKTRALVALLTATIGMTLIATLLNRFVMLPLFMHQSVADNKIMPIIIYGVIPFNFAKGLTISAVVLLIYKSLSPIIKNKQN